MFKNIQILSTKNVPEAFCNQFLDNNIELDIHPFIQTIPLPEKNIQHQIQQLGSESIDVIFTSVTAVNIICDSLNNLSPQWRIYCVGLNTAQKAKQSFPEATIVYIANYGKQLATFLIELEGKTEFTFFCGKSRRDEMPMMMKNAGIQLHEIQLYETVANPIILSKPFDGIVFCSPSAVDSFFSANKIVASTILFSIGCTTTQQIQQYTTNTIITTSIALLENVLTDVLQYFGKKQLEQEI